MALEGPLEFEVPKLVFIIEYKFFTFIFKLQYGTFLTCPAQLLLNEMIGFEAPEESWVWHS